MSDLIDREQAKDAIDKYLVGRNLVTDGTFMARLINEIVIDRLPSAQPYTINPDGRLWITVDDIDKVTAVVVDEHKSKFCKQFYEDAQPKKGKWIYHIDDLFPAESTMECNQCHAEQPLTCDDEFCPHCGAKMEVTE